MTLEPLDVLNRYWGYDEFRPLQKEAIRCALTGRDSVVVLPTGGGKSICYQVPALCHETGVAVIISPLISLMKDQVDGLVASGIAAASLNSAMGAEARSEVIHRLQQNRLRLLYVSPERLVQEGTLEMLKRAEVRFFAIDEAHCISSWGHDFRPEYRQLRQLKQQFPGATVHAFTATATPRVRNDIAQQLGLQNAEKLVGSFHRPNLIYRVTRRSDAIAQICKVVDRYPKQSGIVYCISRKEVDNVAATLVEQGYRAKPYHAGLSDASRAQHQDEFIAEQVDIIVATVAFGMGIDKSSVRYVIHCGMPKSLEAYQQESGRAGRDGLASECWLLFSGADMMLWKKMSEGQPGAKSLLESMYGYCTRTGCRHRMLVEYFGQRFEPESCDACDVCLGERKSVDDPLIVAQKIISCVYRVGQRFGTHHVAAVLMGSASQRILELGHDKLSTYALLSDANKAAVVDWTEQLVGQGFLAKVGEYNVLSITDRGTQLLRGEITPKLFYPAEAPKKSSRQKVDWEGVDAGLFEELRDLRRELAKEKGIPPFVIFHDATLREMAKKRPVESASFKTIQGVGEKKLKDFGDAFSQRIAKYCDSHGIDTEQGILPLQAKISTKTSTKAANLRKVNAAKQRAFTLFAEGKSLEEVAKRIDRAVSTTSGYLSDYIQDEKIEDPTPWVDAETASVIKKAVEQVGELERLAPIKEALGDEVSYEQIRVVVDCLRVSTA